MVRMGGGRLGTSLGSWIDVTGRVEDYGGDDGDGICGIAVIMSSCKAFLGCVYLEGTSRLV